ncbi:MAG: LytTR family DNA-binding domain-containing protein [Saprospiraceae bacterium]
MSLSVIIIEDEPWAATGLQDLINKYDPSIEVDTCLQSIEESVVWLQNNSHPDLIFCDIQLTDGLSFEIFKKISVDCPIIFTTAYDQYALKAFELNSIDYLLKPIDLEALSRGMQKLNRLSGAKPEKTILSAQLLQQISQMVKQDYKARFVVKSGSHLLSIPTTEIIYFFSEHKICWLMRQDGKKFSINQNMEELEKLLNPQQYFRLGRSNISSHEGIEDIISYTNSRLKVRLKFQKEMVVISRDRVPGFKKWLDT